MSKKVAIIQPCYIPWKGYFDIINSVDEFIIYDDVQYTKRHWVNRNKIKTPQGLQWLTIPVNVKGRHKQKINEVTIVNHYWRKKHWKSIDFAYKKTAFFESYRHVVEGLFFNGSERNLLEINKSFIVKICLILGIQTKISVASDYNYEEYTDNVSNVINLLKKANASIFINSPTAKQYMNESMFIPHGIQLLWADYLGYPEYTQLYPPFDHHVSIIDLIFNTGDDAPKYMKSFMKKE